MSWSNNSYKAWGRKISLFAAIHISLLFKPLLSILHFSDSLMNAEVRASDESNFWQRQLVSKNILHLEYDKWQNEQKDDLKIVYR